MNAFGICFARPRLLNLSKARKAPTEELPVMLAKFSIRSKIIAVVALLLVAITGMGLLAVKSMRSINADTVDITTNWLPSVRVPGELRFA
jgi:hypothetical protein